MTAEAIETILEVEDPFSLVGAFEICADRAAQDQRFVHLGDRLLDGLFGDMQRLTRACALFGAIFVITTAHLATHETLQRRPVFWRRLASAAHASLIVRALGGNGIDPDRIISWAMRLFGDAYYFRLCRISRSSPNGGLNGYSLRFSSRTYSGAPLALCTSFQKKRLR